MIYLLKDLWNPCIFNPTQSIPSVFEDPIFIWVKSGRKSAKNGREKASLRTKKEKNLHSGKKMRRVLHTRASEACSTRASELHALFWKKICLRSAGLDRVSPLSPSIPFPIELLLISV